MPIMPALAVVLAIIRWVHRLPLGHGVFLGHLALLDGPLELGRKVTHFTTFVMLCRQAGT